MVKIIILIIFCIIGFYYGWWAKTVKNEINEPTKINMTETFDADILKDYCEGGICPPPEEYRE